MSNCFPIPTACLAAVIASGCMGQSMPDVTEVTKPATEAFSRLGSWRPWPSAQPEPVAPVAPVESAPLAAPSPPPALAQAPRAQSQPHPLPPRVKPVASAARPVARPSRGQQVPASISCQTIANPGQRVRMECKPSD